MFVPYGIHGGRHGRNASTEAGLTNEAADLNAVIDGLLARIDDPDGLAEATAAGAVSVTLEAA